MNASTDNGASSADRSAADLEREGAQIRADLDRTLDEIEHKLSPGELLDRSVDFLRNNGSEFVREAGETVRNNPIPVLLTAAGLIWLTTSIATRHRPRASSYGDEFSNYRGGSEDLSKYGHNDGGIRGEVDEARSRMSHAAHRMTDRVTDKAQDIAGRARGVSSGLMNLVQEQPVALGALALAAGALLGAALPTTKYENRTVGPTRDRTVARAKEMGQREYENLKQAMSSTERRPEGT